jgi:choline transport protein
MPFFILNAVLQTASRLTWALAKDNALLFSNIIQKVHPSLDVPVSSLIFNTASMALCGCIYLASSTGMRKMFMNIHDTYANTDTFLLLADSL